MISLIQTAEGALNETHSILQRMRELAVQSSNDTNTTTDRSEIQKEINQLVEEIDRIGNTTEFNTKKLINGGANVSGTVGSNLTGIEVVGGTGDTTVGASITLTAVTDATKAAETKSGAFTTGAVAGSALSFTVNGTSFSFAVGTTNEKVAETINDAGLGVTASFTAADLTITSNTAGSASKLSTTLSGSLVTTAGTDATVTLSGGEQYSAQGNNVTIESGNAKGLEFTVSQDLSSLSANNTITVASNGTLNFQIGANENQEMNISIKDMRSGALGVSGIDVTSQTSASTAITTINKAIETVSGERSKLGAYQNRLDHTINNLGTSSENLTAAESRIRDVDMAKEMMEQTKNSILSQAAQAMLAQANQQPQGVLQLLR
nr:flagellin [Fredinandcohnia onubensis]